MALELTGKLIEKFDEQAISGSFKKREFVVETNENNFTEQIKFELVQDRTDIIDPYQIGETVKVSFNLKGRKWNDKYFVNVQAWRVERVGASGSNYNELPADMPFPPPPDEDFMDEAPF
ncbi:MAG: DUF3127 domain-containing protein [Bacteroidales bacterium]|nr:DUF3127 domain-containing protein [Bacteroidales bacterium]